MIFTNRYNLPEGMVKALTEDTHTDPKRMSVTDLISSPLIRTLKIERANEITADVSENLWALLGQAIHYVLAKAEGNTELKLEHEYQDLTIVGKLDRYTKEGIIEDYKITSVWSFLNGTKEDWASQLNLYDWLGQKTGLGRAKGLRINAILRDWQMNKTIDKDYPRIPFLSLIVPQWSFEDQQKYVNERLNDHLHNSRRECTLPEKWQGKATFAVMQQGRKKALRVLESYGEAIDWCLQEGLTIQVEPNILSAGIFIVERPAKPIRCQLYCNVRSVCKFANQLKGE